MHKYTDENIIDDFLILSGDGKFIEVSQSFCSAVGYSSDELLEMTIHQIQEKALVAQSCIYFNKILQGETGKHESALTTKGGVAINVEINAKCFNERKNTFVVFVRSTTERNHQATNTDTVQTLFNSLPFGIMLIDKGRKVKFMNTFGLKLLGYSHLAQIKDSSCFDGLCDTKKNNCPILNIKHKIANTEQTLWMHDKTQLSIIKSIVPTVIDNEELLLETFIDFTRHKGIIANLQATKECLQMEKTKAETSGVLKSSFIANMSHEIRTPMNAILGFSKLLKNDENDSTKRAQYVDLINISSRRLETIINDIIDLSKIEADQLHTYISNCNLFAVVNNSYEYFSRSELLSSKPEISLTRNVDDAFRETNIQTDVIRVQQVLDNLISNAIKYTEKGSIEFGYSIKEKLTGKWIEFYVKDTGNGIPENKKDIIFERFYRIEENDYLEGTGLGLSIAKGIVDLLGGQIWFDSTENVGSVFYFTIPYKPSNTQTGRDNSSIEKSDNLNLANKTVLIAEDDYTSYIFLNELLSDTYANIHMVTDGLGVISFMKESTPDLILLDINMPNMNGLECLKLIRKTNKDIKIIVQTAYAMSEERDKYLKEGCNEYISKPIDKDELLKKIKTVLSL